MKFYSLGNPKDVVSFETAVQRGIAPDGSLYFPSEIPQLTPDDITQLVGKPQADVAFGVLWPWLNDEMTEAELRAIIAKACTFETPLVQVGNKRILELFHGPTAAFKDVAARYLAALMGLYNAKTGRNAIVLVATSGDTGGAIAQGFAGVPGTRVVVLYPRGRVSQLQREQLTRVAPNVTSFEVDGTFDDCQDLVKQAFADKSLEELDLTSANSISMGRLLPQITYFAFASLASAPGTPVRFVVPSGNLGDVTAGVLAQKMGFPIASFLAANNHNDLLFRYLQSADAHARPVEATLSNAMDVGRPNNLPRLIRLFDDDHAKLTATITGASISDPEVVDTIKTVWQTHHYLLDPHTAVGWAASEANPDPAARDIIVSTAAPQKFANEIETSCGIAVDNSELLKKLQTRPVRVESISAEYSDFRAKLIELPA
jgi:threonine synthase